MLNLEEILELIEMHGRTILDSCLCGNCDGPIKAAMHMKLDRMRELIEMLPDHVEDAKPEERGHLQ